MNGLMRRMIHVGSTVGAGVAWATSDRTFAAGIFLANDAVCCPKVAPYAAPWQIITKEPQYQRPSFLLEQPGQNRQAAQTLIRWVCSTWRLQGHPNSIIRPPSVAERATLPRRQTGDPGRHECVQPVVSASWHSRLQFCFELLRRPPRAGGYSNKLVSVPLFGRLVLTRRKQCTDEANG